MLRTVVDGIADWFHRMFPAHTGPKGWAFIGGSVVVCIVLFILAQQLKPRGRKAIIVAVTFLAGLFYALEFFLPVTLSKDGQEENALTQFLPVANNLNQIIAALALGLGIYTLTILHGKRLAKAGAGWFNSLTFFVSMISMAFIGVWNWLPVHKDIKVNNNIHDILYLGGLNALEGTMFSIIAFYIASAAYRAFRIRNAEASLLMGAAFIVMLGQVYAGQWLTHWLPTEGLMSNARVETLSDWLLTRVNAPAIRAVGFGLGVGLLATALRIWLSLERGSYFDREV